MSFFEMVQTLLIGPLKLIFEIIFEMIGGIFGYSGLSIVFLGIIINLLALPLYKRADAMQKELQTVEAGLQNGVEHIKKVFSGNEKMMLLQTYYRQNNYKQTDVIKGSVPLLLEIPIFIAAYQFLSHVEEIKNVSFGPVTNLSAPDGMLTVGGVSINVLPFIMTIINIISSAVYLKEAQMKTKLQLYGMSLFFLVFLYGSPSCLLVYWTTNNVFSLVKNILYKSDNRRKMVCIFMALFLMPIVVYTIFYYQTESLGQRIYMILMELLVEAFILILAFIKNTDKTREKKNVKKRVERKWKNKRSVFTMASVFLTFLLGLFIPSNFIAASPQEFVNIKFFTNPLWYIVSSFLLAAGTLLIWLRVIYWLVGQKGKVILERLMVIFSGLAVVNYMFFGTKLGVISAALQYVDGLFFSIGEQIVNVIILLLLACVIYICLLKWKQITQWILFTASAAIGVMSLINIVNIKVSVDRTVEYMTLTESDELFRLSTKGKNVVVIMLDRGMGAYIPYIINEKPALLEQFAGFTYYSNTISFGGYTNFGTPALLGGYEYTPVEMNKRADESLVDKHNEALRVLPVLFANNGYMATMCEPVYANYQMIPDLSIFNEYDNINAYITKGAFNSLEMQTKPVDNNNRNFICLSFMKTMPLFVQPFIYDNGIYHQCHTSAEQYFSSQNIYGMSKAKGISSIFMDSYNVLCNMVNMTSITDENINTYLFLSNEATHDPILLQEPDYVPMEEVDNTVYDAENKDRFTVDGKTIRVETSRQMQFYHANMASLLLLGEWFDYLREHNAYDNTRIIIVSDHAEYGRQLDEMIHDDSDLLKDVELYYPLLLVKDFDSTEFSVSDDFMTNADVSVIAVDGLIENPTNPFTGKAITDTEKYAHDQYIIMSLETSIYTNNGNTFLPARWARVKDDIWNKENWEFYDEEIVLDEYAFPDTN
ncbi:MAG: membrane protein insertase YidC [Clostridium sp.]|nr:membrane protein insertase YidC [Clostridium sp.]